MYCELELETVVGLGTYNPLSLTPFVNVLVRGDENIQVPTIAILDSGSEATLITQSLAEVMRIKKGVTSTQLRAFNGDFLVAIKKKKKILLYYR